MDVVWLFVIIISVSAICVYLTDMTISFNWVVFLQLFSIILAVNALFGGFTIYGWTSTPEKKITTRVITNQFKTEGHDLIKFREPMSVITTEINYPWTVMRDNTEYLMGRQWAGASIECDILNRLKECMDAARDKEN